MKVFRVTRSDRLAYQCDGEYSWLLPPVDCATCGRYRGSYLGYPSLDIEGKLDETPYRSGHPVSPERFEELVAPLKALLTESWPLLPGMGLGPFRGRVLQREKRDFIWLFGRTILIKESAYAALHGEGVSFRTGPAVMTNSKGPTVREDYIRVVQIPPVNCESEETLNYAEHMRCPTCGLHVLTWPKRLILRANAIPTDIDIMAACHSECIVVSERWKSAVQRLGLSNAVFEAVELAT